MALGQGAIVATARALLRVDTTDLRKGLAEGERSFDRSTKKMGDDTRRLERDVERSSKGMGASLATVKKASMALAAVGVVAFGAFAVGAHKAVTAASDLNEQVAKTTVVFRGSERQVLEWSKTTASAIGISRRAALEAAGVFGNMLAPMGFARQEAAAMSTELVQLAADMASFNNASPEETLDAIRAGLAGETEPLRRYGVFLNQARLEQEALTAGLIRKGEKLTAAGKALATYKLILKDTGDAQGDFARTSGSVANQQRIVRARVEDLLATLGKGLLPIVARALAQLNDWIGRLQESESAHRQLNAAVKRGEEIVSGAVDAARSLAPALRAVAGGADAVARAVGGWDDVFKLTAVLLALRRLRGADAVGSGGLLGAAFAANTLKGRLAGLASMQVVIPVYLITKGLEKAFGEQLYGSGFMGHGEGDFNAGTTGDGMPVRGQDGVWRVNGKALGDQEHWERKYAAGKIDKMGMYAGPKQATGPGSSNDRSQPSKSYLTTPSGSTYGGLQSGALTLAGFVERSGGTISAGKEGGHSPTGGHGVGQSLDISWANNGPRIWAALFPHRAKFRLLLGPPGLYMWGEQYFNERDAKNHRNHIHVQYQGTAAALHKMLGDAAPELTGADIDTTGGGNTDFSEDGQTGTSKTAAKPAKKATGPTESQLQDRAERAGASLARVPGLAAALGAYDRVSAGQRYTTLGGGLGRVLISFEPTAQQWQALVKELTKKLRAALARRRVLASKLKAAQRLPKRLRSKSLIAAHQSALQQLDAAIKQLRGALGAAISAIRDLRAAAAAEEQRDAGEDENIRADEIDVTALDSDLQLEIAEAEGTVDTGDDVAALQKAESELADRLLGHEIPLFGGDGFGFDLTQTGTERIPLSTEDRVRVQRELNDVRGRIRSILEQQEENARREAELREQEAVNAAKDSSNVDQAAANLEAERRRLEEQARVDELVRQNVIGFLTATRGLRSLSSNVLEQAVSGLGPGTPTRPYAVTINQAFPMQPDPLTWSKGIEFELQALVGGS